MKNLIVLLLLSISATSALAAQSGQSLGQVENEDTNRNFLFRVEPHWLVFNEASFDFQFKVNENFTIGPTIAIMSQGPGVFYGNKIAEHLFMTDKTDRQSYGLRGVYYINGVDRSTPYIAGFGEYQMSQVTSSSGSISEKGKFNETKVGATAGYQWAWGLLTLNVGGGLEYFNHPSNLTLTDNSGFASNYHLDSDSIGYALDVGLGFHF